MTRKNNMTVVYNAVKKCRKNDAAKGLKPFQILGVSEELKTKFNEFKKDSGCGSASIALEKLLKIANDNKNFWIV